MDHRRLWQLVEEHGDLDLPVFLRIVLREAAAPLVDIVQPQPDSAPICTVDGIELIGGPP